MSSMILRILARRNYSSQLDSLYLQSAFGELDIEMTLWFTMLKVV